MDLHDTRFLQRQPLNQSLAERKAQLAAIAAELKTELFGIDEVIDRVIESVRAWYVLAEIITRPVIVCLWGLTGTGKTQLTLALTHKLGFYDRFVDVQMDGFSNGGQQPLHLPVAVARVVPALDCAHRGAVRR